MNNTLLYLTTVLIWGSTWLAINYQLGDVAPEASIAYRFGLAALVLFVICLIRKQRLSFGLRDHLRMAAFGMCLFCFNYFMLYQAQTKINSALSCIAFSTLMLMNMVNGRIWFKTKIRKQTYLGGALGLIGIVILFWPQIEHLSLTDDVLYGLVLCLIGTAFASTGNMLSISTQKRALPVMSANAWGMMYGALVMSVLLLVQGKSFSFAWTPAYVGSLLFLSILGSVVAFTCYLTLMTRIGADKTSYANILFPAVAVVLSTIFEGFVWNHYTVIGFVSIMAGNVAMLLKPAQLALLKSKVLVWKQIT